MKKFLLTIFISYGVLFMGQVNAQNLQKATFAGGCFWCIESSLEDVEGVLQAVSGYMGGSKEDADYEKVSSGTTGHYEAVEITYDPAKVSYEQLLDIFWQNIDPTQEDGQFADKGSQYKTVIFYHDEQQKKIAEASKEKLQKEGPFKKPIVTKILPAEIFYPAEEYHQNYYKKQPDHYKNYHYFSGRGPFIEKKWGKKPK